MSNHYANQESVSERIVQAVASLLETVTEANGYWVTVGTVVTNLPQRGDTTRYPLIEVLTGREEVLNDDISDDALHKYLYLRLLCYHAPNTLDAESARIFQQRMKSDLEYLFGNNWMLKGDDDAPRCRLAMVIGSAPFPRLDGQNFVGVSVDLRIGYAQDVHDPSVQV